MTNLLNFTGTRDAMFELLINQSLATSLTHLKKKYPNHYEKIDAILKDKDLINVELSKTMKSNGGYANYRTRNIKLNKRLHQLNLDELGETFIHELAHIISNDLYGKKGRGHGKNWKYTMSLLGKEATRCHKMDVSTIVKRHAWKCNCMTHKVSTRRHSQLLRSNSYFCKKCKSSLTKGKLSC